MPARQRPASEGAAAAGYWNHNTAYHPWLLRAAGRHVGGTALDIGCGDGLLVQRLAPLFRQVTGIEPHLPTYEKARTRLAHLDNATLLPIEFGRLADEPERFDAITFVASLHHLELPEALDAAARLLRPGGVLLVVGLSANRTAYDWLLSGLALPIVRIGSRLHGEGHRVGFPVARPRESLSEIRSVTARLLPGRRIRRALYYRYLLRWTKPAA